MTTSFKLKTSLAIAALVMLPVAHAANLSKADYSAGKTRISAVYKADKASCAALAGNIKDICTEEAKAKEQVASAELEVAYTGKASDQNEVLVVKAKSARVATAKTTYGKS